MYKKIIKIFFFIIIVYCFSSSSYGYKSGTIMIGKIEIDLEVCETNYEQILGLGGRKKIAEDYAMLFPYSKSEERIFWMKGMLIAIDIIWVNKGKIVHIEKNVPPPNMLNQKLETYGHGVQADTVVEVAAGFSDRNGIKLGDEVKYVIYD